MLTAEEPGFLFTEVKVTKKLGSKASYVSLHSPKKYELKKCKKGCDSNLIKKKKSLRSPKCSNEKNTLMRIAKENHCSPWVCAVFQSN